jgi:di/tricarboxylate transporter
MAGRTSSGLRLRSRWGVNLLAVSRQGRPIRARLGAFQFQPGDVLLLQGTPELLTQLANSLGCLPLAERGLKLGTPRRTWLTIGIFAAAIIAATIGLTSLVIALSVAVAAIVVLNVMPVRDIYQSVDWPIIVLLGAMIPVGGALESTDATVIITDAIARVGDGIAPSVVLILIMVITMTLSDIMNNAATAVVMAPISVDIAETLGVSADPFLMAVAIGASCAFLTPIGHQNNTLILGPGGYRFGDYWRMGLPLEVLIVVISVPLILVVWPL